MNLFTADWHIKLGQKNVPIPWACTRYKLFFDKIYEYHLFILILTLQDLAL